MVKFLERFRCYLEGSRFEIFTDAKCSDPEHETSFLANALESARSRMARTSGKLGVFPITLKSGRIHVLGDTLSRAKLAEKSGSETNLLCINGMEVSFVEFENVVSDNGDDQFFDPIVRALKDEGPNTVMRRV